MKIFNSTKNILSVLVLLFSYSAMAQVGTYELSLVREVDAKNTELTFLRKVEGKKASTIVASDDDGLLTLAAINIALNQPMIEALKVVSNDAIKRGLSPEIAIKNKWYDGMSDKELGQFPSLKPAIVSALKRYSLYLAERVRVKSSKMTNASTAKEWEEFGKLQREAADAAVMEQLFIDKETLTRGELSATLGSLLKEYAGSHSYNARVDGRDGTVSLTGPDALGYLFGSRAFRVDEDITAMKASRGKLILAKDVFVNTGGDTIEASTTTNSSEHVDTLFETLLEADQLEAAQ